MKWANFISTNVKRFYNFRLSITKNASQNDVGNPRFIIATGSINAPRVS